MTGTGNEAARDPSVDTLDQLAKAYAETYRGPQQGESAADRGTTGPRRRRTEVDVRTDVHRPLAVTTAAAGLGALAVVLSVYQTAGIVHGRHRLTDLVRGQVERHLAVQGDQSVLNGVTAALIVVTVAVVVLLARTALLLAHGSRPAWRISVAVFATLLVARVVTAATGVGGRIDDAMLPERVQWLDPAAVAVAASAASPFWVGHQTSQRLSVHRTVAFIGSIGAWFW